MAGPERDHGEREKPSDEKAGANRDVRKERAPAAVVARAPARPWAFTGGTSNPAVPPDSDAATSLQRSHGNQFVQRLLASSDGAAQPQGRIASTLKDADGGRPLEPHVRSDMEGRLGTSLPDVRVHTDGGAAGAARDLNARAFTTGHDIYFGSGTYDPSSAHGRALLAHELVHTLQQRDRPGAAPNAALEVTAPDDPLERQAERIANQVARSGSARPESWITPGSLSRARVYRQAIDAALKPGATPEGDFVVGLGGGLKVKKEEIEASHKKGRYEKDLSSMSLPGLKVKRLTLELDRETAKVEKGHVTAGLEVPFLKLEGKADARFNIDAQGKTSFQAKGKIAAPGLSEPELEVTLAEGNISAAATLTPEKLKVPGVPKLKVLAASVEFGLDKGKLKGSGGVTLEYPGVARGNVDVEFKNGAPAGKGRIELLPDYLKGVEAALEITEGNLQGEVTVPAAKLAPPVPGLSITDGTLKLGMKNGQLSGAGEGIKFAYNKLGEGELSFSIRKDRIEGNGALTVNIPGLAPVKGELRFRDSALSGKATITADKFPKGLPVKGGSITVIVDDKGGIGGRGAVTIDLLGVGSGELKLGYEKGILDLAADVSIKKVPGLEEGRVLVGMKDGQLEGEGQINVAPKQIPGLTGQVTVYYKESRFSGKGKIGYAKDKISGEVELVVDQDDKGKLALSGAGDVTARLTDWLTGRVRLEIRPDASYKIAGQLKADDIELFPAKKVDKELFSLSQNIPLWAVLVAVIRIRTGVRAGVGPGMLRGVTAEGEFGSAATDEPAFSITGELFIPAFAEAYVAFGAGLGLDVLIGSLTGGIEAVGTAGIYGAVSVIPELAYKGGNWSISGVATLAAGAKLKLGLQAWAEVEALWITVWENTWQLGEWVWDVGPELGLQANVNYVFGRPEPPTFDFKTSDIDTHKLVQDAMPKDGPKGSGARDALKNTAAWKGALKAENKDPGKIPSELADKSGKTPVPKGLPPKPSKKGPPPEAAKDPAKAKAGAEKDLKDKAAPDKAAAPADKAHDEKATKAFAALEALVEKSAKNPEDPDEIVVHLADLKSQYGFKTLTHRLEGKEWVIDAGMSPKRSARARAQKAKEGEAGTYNDLQGATGDQITPDHEPQNAVMTFVSQDLRFRNRKLFKDTPVADYSMGQGICMNMFHDRHKETRTYSGRGGSTKATALSDIKQALDDLPENASDARARKAVAKIVRRELAADHEKIRDIYATSDLVPATKDRVNKSLGSVWRLNRGKYFEAFDE